MKVSEFNKFCNERLSEELQKREGRAADWNVILDPITAAQLSYAFEQGKFSNLQEYLLFIAPKVFEAACNMELSRTNPEGMNPSKGIIDFLEFLKRNF